MYPSLIGRTFTTRQIMFFAGKPLFLRRGDNLAVDDQRRRTVVIECRNTQNVQSSVFLINVRFGMLPYPHRILFPHIAFKKGGYKLLPGSVEMSVVLPVEP